MNTVVLTGNLGQDPESFTLLMMGTHIVNFSLAFRSTKVEKTNWIKVAAFKKVAESAVKYLHKGARVSIMGILDMDEWENDNGEKRTMIKLIARSIEFIKTDGRGFEDTTIRMMTYPFEGAENL
jgi:single-strand DNA-binding protein